MYTYNNNSALNSARVGLPLQHLLGRHAHQRCQKKIPKRPHTHSLPPTNTFSPTLPSHTQLGQRWNPPPLTPLAPGRHQPKYPLALHHYLCKCAAEAQRKRGYDDSSREPNPKQKPFTEGTYSRANAKASAPAPDVAVRLRRGAAVPKRGEAVNYSVRGGESK